MSLFDKVKGYFERGLWSEGRVQMAVNKGWITSEECESILHPVVVEPDDLYPEQPTPVESEDEYEEFE